MQTYARERFAGFFYCPYFFITMDEYMSVRSQSCPNTLCEFHGKSQRGNVAVHSRKFNRLRCTECKKTWVSHRNEPHYALQNDFAMVQCVLQLLAQGVSVRKTSAQCGVSPSTVQRWKTKFKNLFNS